MDLSGPEGASGRGGREAGKFLLMEGVGDAISKGEYKVEGRGEIQKKEDPTKRKKKKGKNIVNRTKILRESEKRTSEKKDTSLSRISSSKKILQLCYVKKRSFQKGKVF